MKKLFQDLRRLRLGGISLGLSGIAIALAIVVILSADTLEHRKALRLDYSFNGITTQSEATNKVLDHLTKPVHAYALSSPGQEDRALLGLLERYAARTKYFTYSEENLARNPLLVTNISSSLSDSEVTSDSLIIYCKETDRSRILNGNQYIRQGYDGTSESVYIAGLEYEKSITEAILHVSADKLPELQLLTGHGELTRADITALDTLLQAYSYNLRDVDLIRGDALDHTMPLLILSPRKDLSEKELAAIDAFTKAGGSLFITEDFTSAEPQERFGALYRGYGFQKLPGLVVADAPGDYYESPAVLMPYMEESDITFPLIAGNQDSLLLAGSAAFQEPRSDSAVISHVILRSGQAYLRAVDQSFSALDKQEGDPEGRFPLALVSDRVFEDGNRSRAFIIGNSSLFTDQWMHQNTYSAEFLLNVLSYLSPGEKVQLAISPKDAIRAPFVTSAPWLVILVLVLLPLSAVFAALFVLLPRKRM